MMLKTKVAGARIALDDILRNKKALDIFCCFEYTPVGDNEDWGRLCRVKPELQN